MTKEDIIRMAREAGVPFNKWGLIGCDNCEQDIDEDLERFFHMAQAAEREACAGLVEDWDRDGHDPRDIATAIRARGQS